MPKILRLFNGTIVFIKDATRVIAGLGRYTAMTDVDTTHGWILVGLLPLFFDAPPIGVLGWAAALIAGSLIANQQSLRWVAVGWAASAVAWGTPLVGVAVAGSVCENWRTGLRAAALGGVLGSLGLLGLPELVRQAGLWLILAACAVALTWRPR